MTPAKRGSGWLKPVLAVVLLLAVIALIVFADTIERRLHLMPAPDAAGPIARILAIMLLLAIVAAFLVRFVRGRRSAARTAAIRSTSDGVAATATRTKALVEAVGELYPDVDAPALGRALGANFTVLADRRGVSLWSGSRRPEALLVVPWQEIRTVRSDAVTVGDASRPALVLRVRHAGASLELPVLLMPGRRERSEPGERLGRRGEESFAIVRRFKAAQRDYLLQSGLTFDEAMERTPFTSPIDVATARAELERERIERERLAHAG